tara:strand:+ start:152 stop:313 length:162 start_codon:yes stop_codon:yes gene_type:complete
MFRQAVAALAGRGDLAAVPRDLESKPAPEVKRLAEAYSAGQFALFRGLVERRR